MSKFSANGNTDASGGAAGAASSGAHRLYSAQDMARISSSACAGCGACCRGMGDTIVLDPYDVWQMGLITGKTFEELMGAGIDLHVEEGVILPSKVRIDRWIGIEDLPRYEEYKAEWRSLLRTLQARIAAEPSVEVQRNVNLYFLRTFYMTPYEGDAAAFYGELAARTRDFAAAAL